MEPYLTKKTALTNKAAVKVAELFNITNIADLNTLHYAVTSLICDVIPEGDGQQHKVPVDRKENALQKRWIRQEQELVG
eukprot:3597745-Ditylum_brightwellii.AAC.1